MQKKEKKIETPVIPEPAKEQLLNVQTEQALSPQPLAEEVPLEKVNKKLYIIGIGVVVIILSASAFLFYLASLQTKTTSVTTKTVKKIQKKVIKVVPLERSAITLEVLNGSTTPGRAGKVAKVFEALGYTVTKTGNADPTSTNILLVQDTVKNALAVLLSDVSKELSISSISGELTDTTSSARIILGEN